ncbi:PAAR domain-containing protein [Pantoea sp.]|uniref:PAAR domain-containing protein n=1 Tax=Pantoea sp. TaxID=69393 RepID=UPI0028981CCE|nr:PAAR domain-containing protein [Pantoea sp.]
MSDEISPVARVDDFVTCPQCIHTRIISGSPNVFIEGKSAARSGDHCKCGGGISASQKKVKINGLDAAYVNTNDTGHTPVNGAKSVFIGNRTLIRKRRSDDIDDPNVADLALRLQRLNIHEPTDGNTTNLHHHVQHYAPTDNSPASHNFLSHHVQHYAPTNIDLNYEEPMDIDEDSAMGFDEIQAPTLCTASGEYTDGSDIRGKTCTNTENNTTAGKRAGNENALGFVERENFGRFVYRADTRPPDEITAEGFHGSSYFEGVPRMINGDNILIASETQAGATQYGDENLLQYGVETFYVYRIDATHVRGASLMESVQSQSRAAVEHQWRPDSRLIDIAEGAGEYREVHLDNSQIPASHINLVDTVYKPYRDEL